MEVENLEVNSICENEAELVEVDIISHPSEFLYELKPQENTGCDGNRSDLSNGNLYRFVSTAQSDATQITANMNSTKEKEFSEKLTENHPTPNITCLQKVEFNSLDEGIPDESDIYKRFYFESDHLALKDNPDYQLLLQTLVALEAQQKQAVKDYEKLIKMRKDALTEPIKFVEKLQNNEPLGIPARQNLIRVPQINWETYSGTIDDFSQFGLLHQHNTRYSAAPGLEKANQKWEEQSTTSNGSIADGSQDSIRLSSSIECSRYVRGKRATNDKSATFNQPWTAEEQRKLERLLQVYPQEAVEAKRWAKIANALGHRTPKQVASRVQKYFIKLAKAGLPIPGRLPNLNRVLAKVPRARSTQQQQQVVSFRNSTFFPSYQPRVYMEDNEKSDANSVATSDDFADVSDEEAIPEELRNTKEYVELLQIKRLKRKRTEQQMMNKGATEHHGFMCDSCGMSPIMGVRWHCLDCPQDTSTDLCGECNSRKEETDIHRSHHKMEPIDWIAGDFVDGDYLKLGESSKGYNYLDPNFLPAAT